MNEAYINSLPTKMRDYFEMLEADEPGKHIEELRIVKEFGDAIQPTLNAESLRNLKHQIDELTSKGSAILEIQNAIQHLLS